jgi:hypothetical protein
MDGFDPTSSFGPDVAARYDDHLRGDEDVAADLLAGLAGDGRPSSWRSARGASPHP